ncbi:MAG: hypothetical protein HFE39_04790 [Clostridiales bacterium]|nr:hypothetical protein [Clostridiales bacterium]
MWELGWENRKSLRLKQTAGSFGRSTGIYLYDLLFFVRKWFGEKESNKELAQNKTKFDKRFVIL